MHFETNANGSTFDAAFLKESGKGYMFNFESRQFMQESVRLEHHFEMSTIWIGMRV